MKVSLLLGFLHLGAVHALWPVKDFRVDDLPSTSDIDLKSNIKNENIDTLVHKDVATSSNATEGPVFIDNVNLQYLFTDNASSIYYLYANISDSRNEYNDQFALLLDTGSSITWLYNETCTENGCSKLGVNKFDDFSDSIVPESDFHLSYTGETVAGDIVSLEENNLSLTFGNSRVEFSNLSIGLTSNSPEMFKGYAISGLLGISSSNNNDPVRNIVSQYYASNRISKEMFALFLKSNNQTITHVDSNNKEFDPLPNDFGGMVIFGAGAQNYLDSFPGKTIYTKVIDNDNAYWLINITQVDTTNSTAKKTFTFDSRGAIIDTGTTGIVLPVTDADALHESLFGNTFVTDGKGNYAFPCNTENSSIFFSLDDGQLEVSSSFFMGDSYDQPGLQGLCALKIQGIDGYNNWVLGASFLNKFYTVFDLEKKQIGFVDADVSSVILKQESILTDTLFVGSDVSAVIDPPSSSDSSESSGSKDSKESNTTSNESTDSSKSTVRSKQTHSSTILVSSATSTKTSSSSIVNSDTSSSSSAPSTESNNSKSHNVNNGTSTLIPKSFTVFMSVILSLFVCVLI